MWVLARCLSSRPQMKPKPRRFSVNTQFGDDDFFPPAMWVCLKVIVPETDTLKWRRAINSAASVAGVEEGVWRKKGFLI